MHINGNVIYLDDVWDLLHAKTNGILDYWSNEAVVCCHSNRDIYVGKSLWCVPRPHSINVGKTLHTVSRQTPCVYTTHSCLHAYTPFNAKFQVNLGYLVIPFTFLKLNKTSEYNFDGWIGCSSYQPVHCAYTGFVQILEKCGKSSNVKQKFSRPWKIWQYNEIIPSVVTILLF